MTSSPERARALVLCAGIAVMDYRLPGRGISGAGHQDPRQRLFAIQRRLRRQCRGRGGAARRPRASSRPARRTGRNRPRRRRDPGEARAGRRRPSARACASTARLVRSRRSSIDRDGERDDRELSRPTRSTQRAPRRSRRARRRRRRLLVDNRFPDFVLPICAGRAPSAAYPWCSTPTSRRGGRPLFDARHACHLFVARPARPPRRRRISPPALSAVAARTAALPRGHQRPGRHALWLDGGRARRLPVFRVEAVDTLGAGDVFHGGLRAGAGRGPRVELPPCASAPPPRRSNARVSAAVSGAPRRAEVEAFLACRPKS